MVASPDAMHALLFALLFAQTDEAAIGAALAANQSQPTSTTFPGMFNPEVSVIGTFSGAWRRDAEVDPFVVAGDDAPVDRVSAQELEFTFAANVDPYFQMRAFLAIPDAREVEIEEAFLVTTSLPFHLQVKAGTFRSAFGRNNEQHLHLQDFARRPWTTALLGDDGLRGPGLQLNVLAPTPIYLAFWAEGFTFAAREASAAAGVETFFELSDAWSLLLGASGATVQRGPEEPEPGMMPSTPPRTALVGGDLYLRWRPLDGPSQRFVALTMEYVALRQDADGAPWGGAAYAQVVAQVARRWRLGLRADLLGLPRDAAVEAANARALGGSASLAFQPSEYARIRLAYQHEQDLDDDARANDTVFLQLEATMGAHGAHPF